MKTYIIVGAGLFGITIANCLSKYHKVLLIEKRSFVGGNCFDYVDENTGITVHKYGPHIFHIQDQQIYKYINKFTQFNNYKHHVKTQYKNKIYDFPINLSTINSFYDINLRPYEVKSFLMNEAKKAKIDRPKNMAEKIISLIGNDLYEAFFKDYTTKQWGKDPTLLPESIISRIPIRENYDSCYYKKYFNGIPTLGFSTMFKKMLSSKNISIQLSTDFLNDKDYFMNKGIIIFTGPIDAFFGYKYGNLEYRSLYFEKEYYNTEDFQGISVLNYPELKYKYTRICEPKHFYPEKKNIFQQKKTILIKEIPYSAIDSEPYYPIQDDKNKRIFQKYLDEAKELKNIYFGGRLGEYRYYDMEDTIKSARNLANALLVH